jgi:hypothetical protein
MNRRQEAFEGDTGHESSTQDFASGADPVDAELMQETLAIQAIASEIMRVTMRRALREAAEIAR